MPATPPGTREAQSLSQSRGEPDSCQAVVTRGKGWTPHGWRLRNVLSPLVRVFTDGVQFHKVSKECECYTVLGRSRGNARAARLVDIRYNCNLTQHGKTYQVNHTLHMSAWNSRRLLPSASTSLSVSRSKCARDHDADGSIDR